MILNDLVKTVKRKSHRGDQAVTTDLITQDIVACVNETIREVVRLLPQRLFFTQATLAVPVGVVATPQLISLPTDTQEPIIFHYTLNSSFYRLYKVNSEEEWFKLWNPTTALGLPQHFREVGPDVSGNKQIEIYPPSESILALKMEYYRVKGADLTTAVLGAQLPDIPDYLQDIVEKGALYYFLKGFDDQLQQVAKADYEQAKLAYVMAEQSDQDANLCFRFDVQGPSPYNSVRFTT